MPSVSPAISSVHQSEQACHSSCCCRLPPHAHLADTYTACAAIAALRSDPCTSHKERIEAAICDHTSRHCVHQSLHISCTALDAIMSFSAQGASDQACIAPKLAVPRYRSLLNAPVTPSPRARMALAASALAAAQRAALHAPRYRCALPVEAAGVAPLAAPPPPPPPPAPVDEPCWRRQARYLPRRSLSWRLRCRRRRSRSSLHTHPAPLDCGACVLCG